MSILDKLRGEFIDIIEWTEPSNNEVLAYRFPRYNNEIKNGAKLTVREGQAGVRRLAACPGPDPVRKRAERPPLLRRRVPHGPLPPRPRVERATGPGG